MISHGVGDEGADGFGGPVGGGGFAVAGVRMIIGTSALAALAPNPSA